MPIVFEYYKLAVRDSHGNTWSGVVDDMSDTIQVYGMKDKKGESLHFESDAYHISTWCHHNGLEYWSSKCEDEAYCF